MLVNFIEMLKKAKEEKYAVAHFNINNLEWTKYILEECQEKNVPVILGVSEGALKYMGGANTIVGMVKGLIKDLNITIPVCLHIDHGKSYEVCKNAIDAGFSSVMIDKSRLPLEENIKITKQVVDYAHQRGVSVEAEVGKIGGSEDDDEQEIAYADVDECLEFYGKTGVDALAPALGSVHGFYKKPPVLEINRMKTISSLLPIPLVLHGGSGIDDEQIRKAIDAGTAKINVNTELQDAWSKDVKKTIKENEKIYDPRKIIGSGEENLKRKIDEKLLLFKTKS